MEILNAYACYNVDSSKRQNSSSGGVFSALAEYVIAMHGVVYGVAMSDDCYTAEFIAVADNGGLIKLRGSKYLQAKVGDTYRHVKSDLVDGKLVLFTGTPCQINGLHAFLGKEYDNLYCMDIICHGVPSPALWKQYIEWSEKTNGEKVTGVNFRSKDKGWKKYGIKKNFQTKQAFTPRIDDPFMQMFLKNYCLRPSCYQCNAKTDRTADITIGDFWGIDAVAPELNDDKGASAIIVRTEKGVGLFAEVNSGMKYIECSYEEIVRENTAEYKSVQKPPQRDTLMLDMNRLPFKTLKRKYVDGNLKQRTKKVLKKLIRWRKKA